MSHTPSPRAIERARRDEEVLAWIGRFRFVTAGLLAERFGVSVEKTNKRLRRLEHDRLIARRRTFPDEHFAVFLTGAGATRVGLPTRHAPRPDVQREHELAIVWLATRLELAGHKVRTERECRQLEARTNERRSVDLEFVTSRKDRSRWPDLVLERPDGLMAFEIEFSPKGSRRLAAIINAYVLSPVYREVRYLLTDPALAARVTHIAHDQAGEIQRRRFVRPRAHVAVAAWPGSDPTLQQKVTSAIAAARAEQHH